MAAIVNVKLAEQMPNITETQVRFLEQLNKTLELLQAEKHCFRNALNDVTPREMAENAVLGSIHALCIPFVRLNSIADSIEHL